MDWSEPLASQYPDNVVEKFANAFSRQTAFDGPGSCVVTYSRQHTAVICMPDITFTQPICAIVVLIVIGLIVRAMCYKK